MKKGGWGESASRVDYDRVRVRREPLLRAAFANMADKKPVERFRKKNAAWVEDYALFMAIKARMNGRPWTQWEEGLRLREPAALKAWREELAGDIAYHVFTQYLFFQQWKDLKKYANKKGVQLIGDAPIYVSPDSADVWAQPGLFQLDENNLPTEVAGCPPDAFSDDGQLWGNPLYRWDVMEEDGFAWWVRRIKANLAMFDVLRIDHFRGFESYYAIPFGGHHRPEWPVEERPRGQIHPGGEPGGGGRGHHRRGPGRHHPGGAAAAEEQRLPGHEGAPIRLQPGRRASTCPTI